MGGDMNKYQRYLQRLKNGYGLSRSEQIEWVKLAREWMRLYKEAGNTRMYRQVEQQLKTYANGARPARKRTSLEEDHTRIAKDVLR